MSLLARLFLLVLIASLPAVGIQVYNVLELRRAREAELHVSAERWVLLLESEQARLVEGVRQVLVTIAEASFLYDLDAPRCQAFMARVDTRYPDYQDIMATNPQGQVICASDSSLVGTTLGDSAMFREAMRTGDFRVGEHIASRLNHRPALPFVIAYRTSDGRRGGVLAMTVSLDWLEAFLAQKPLPANSSLTIADRNGIILSRIPSNAHDNWIGERLPEALRALMWAPSRETVEMVGLDGVSRVIAFSPLNDSLLPDLFFSVGIDKSVSLKAIEGATLRGVAMILAGLLAALASAWLGGRYFIRRPVERLLVAADRWRSGDYTARAGLRDSQSEIGRLGRAMDVMAATLQDREHAERDREYAREEANAMARKMAAVLESTTDGVFEVDHNYIFIFTNDRACQMIAGGRALVGRGLWEAFPEAIGTTFERAFRHVMREQTPVDFEAFYPPFQTWYAVRVFPSKEGLAVYFQDITARRRAEEESRTQQAKYQAIVDTAVDPIAVIDDSGTIQSFNRAAEAIYGYGADEVIGKNVSILMPEPNRTAHDSYLTNYLRTGERKVIGIGREVMGRRKDGSTFPLHLSVAGWHAGGRRYFTGIMRDITEEKRAERDLREAKEAAERANFAKSKFLAAASHDLRQPVQSLFFFTAALSAQLREHASTPVLDSMQRALDALKMLLDGLLDISRLDAGIIRPEVSAFPVNALLRRLAAEYEQRSAQKGLKLRLVSTSVLVETDPTLLERLLRNLIENALRYTREGGILVGCRRRKGGVSIEVWDSGIGIPEGRLEEIFDEFTQVANPERDREQGLGLGLAIVQRLARLLGYGVRVRSVLGRGSMFAVEVPQAALAPAPSLPADDAAERDGDRNLVMVIDDEVIVLMGMRVMLEGWGYEVIAVSSQEQALNALEESGRCPDIVIADYRLRDGRTGLEALRAIRRHCDREIPSIVLTGDTAPERMQEAQHSGFSILHKPVSAPHLRTLMAAAGTVQ